MDLVNNAFIVIVIFFLLIFIVLGFMMGPYGTGPSSFKPGNRSAELIGFIVLIATIGFLIFMFASSWI